MPRIPVCVRHFPGTERPPFEPVLLRVRVTRHLELRGKPVILLRCLLLRLHYILLSEALHDAIHPWPLWRGSLLYEARLRHAGHGAEPHGNFGVTTGSWGRVLGIVIARATRRHRSHSPNAAPAGLTC